MNTYDPTTPVMPPAAPSRFRWPVAWLAIELAAILAGYLTAYTTVVLGNGLGDPPSKAAALCSAVNLHTAACSDFSTASNVGILLIAAGAVALIITGVRAAVLYQRYRDQPQPPVRGGGDLK
jgi:hypothetical protein